MTLQMTSARPEMTAAMTTATGLDEEVLRALVHRFYDKVRGDAVLGPIFAARNTDWGPHLDRMVIFWSSVVLMTGRYHGRPVPAHASLSIDASHFDRWLALFRQTVQDLCTPEGAVHVTQRAVAPFCRDRGAGGARRGAHADLTKGNPDDQRTSHQ